ERAADVACKWFFYDQEFEHLDTEARSLDLIHHPSSSIIIQTTPPDHHLHKVRIRSIYNAMRLFACANPSRSISRPQWLHASPHRRPIHLLQAASRRDTGSLESSRRETVDFYPANFYEKASNIHISLRTYNDSKLHEMTLETAISKFSKPCSVLLPILQPRKLRSKEAPQYYFKPIDKSKFGGEDRHVLDIYPNRDGLPAFEASMAQAWMLLKKGLSVKMQIHIQETKGIVTMKKMCHKNIHLRPDVILSVMPTNSDIIIDPQTDHKTVWWVMGGPVKNTEELMMVKPRNRTEEYYRRKQEALHADMDPTEERLKDIEHKQADLGSEEHTPIKKATLSPEQQEWEDYKELEVVTGMRPPHDHDFVESVTTDLEQPKGDEN
ncbi:hypothetical protein V8E51_017377, partial [Hyaloscypha variabilis]